MSVAAFPYEINERASDVTAMVPLRRTSYAERITNRPDLFADGAGLVNRLALSITKPS